LAQALGDLKTKTRFCSTCFNLTEDDPCAICADSQRDRAQLMVVEEPLDLMAMERTGIYRGRYHVLHGAIRPIEGIGPNELKIPQLLARLQSEPILELIIATNPSTEGEATAHTIQRYLEGVSVKITRLARGLPTGGDLEHVDALTLIKALQGRSSLS
jgi:recombination protein RecR